MNKPGRKPRPSIRRQSGLSLVELMVSMVIALLVIAGASLMFLATLRANADNIAIMRLNQDLRNSMQFIARDVRRAGHIGEIHSRCVGNPGGLFTSYCELILRNTNDSKLLISGNNILYFYDAPGVALRTTVPTGTDYDFEVEGSPLRARLSLAGSQQPLTASGITVTDLTFNGGTASITLTGTVTLRSGETYQRVITQQVFLRNHLQ